MLGRISRKNAWKICETNFTGIYERDGTSRK